MIVAIYARTATKEKTYEHTTEHQIDKLKQHCKTNGWSVYNTFSDAGFSGININRPALQEMMAEIKSGKIDKVLISSLDRLSRSMADTSFIINELKTNNVDLEILKG